MPVKLIHLEQRSGLIQARLKGSSIASGEILLFLDAHVEVTEGWLEPLVVRVAENRFVVSVSLALLQLCRVRVLGSE